MHKTATISLLVITVLLGSGCQTLQQIANLRFVEFDIDRVTNAELASVNLDRVRSQRDLGAIDLARIGAALATGSLPFEFTLHLGAENPSANNTPARLIAMDWTLFLEDRETISGTLDQNILLPAGQRTDIPIPIRLDLVDFFGHNLTDLVELALAVSGQGGRPKDIKIMAQPTIDTPLGPIRYPQPITIAAHNVGS